MLKYNFLWIFGTEIEHNLCVISIFGLVVRIYDDKCKLKEREKRLGEFSWKEEREIWMSNSLIWVNLTKWKLNSHKLFPSLKNGGWWIFWGRKENTGKSKKGGKKKGSKDERHFTCIILGKSYARDPKFSLQNFPERVG